MFLLLYVHFVAKCLFCLYLGFHYYIIACLFFFSREYNKAYTVHYMTVDNARNIMIVHVFIRKCFMCIYIAYCMQQSFVCPWLMKSF